ncbi:hypothetical protein SynMITS9220_02342 [Synechococcus sp. MIT S9220]|nr:hypothetical protein SynMITS9220_02342 [Synechococcus sp. MIT S9220]
MDGRVSGDARSVGTDPPRLQPLSPAAAVTAANWRNRRRFNNGAGTTTGFMLRTYGATVPA